MRIGVGAVVVVAVGVCGWFVVVQNALAPLVCFTVGDQGAMVEMFEDDPLYSAMPADGHLSEETATTYDCDNGHGGSPTTPQFAQVTRLYTVPAVYSLAQMHGRFTQAARAAGWLILGERDDGDDPASVVSVRYCKLFGERVADAWVSSRRGLLGPEIEVMLDARRVSGSLCSA
jgi:hypothetical protein